MSVVLFPAAPPLPPAEPVDIGAALDAIRHAAGALQGVRLADATAQIRRRIERLAIDEPHLAQDQKAGEDFQAAVVLFAGAAAFQAMVRGLGPRVMGADNAAT